MTRKYKSIVLTITATLSGFCNALLGAGGGILLTLIMGKILIDKIPDRRDLLVTSQAAMIPGCALSCIIYGISGILDTEGFSIFAIPAVAGGALGSLLLTKINSKWIGRIFAALVIWSGIRMIIG
jgi:uncharacterized membrane protein YfcA